MIFIEAALPDTPAWIRHFEQSGVPVLARTSEALAELKEDIDDISPRDVSDVIIEDPLMSLKVLIWANKHLTRNIAITGSSLANEIETVETALVSVGIGPFFRQFEHLDTVEERLADIPEAQLGLLRVLQRSLNAANFARDWAGYRNDLDIEVIVEAAMLHDVAEVLVWIFAPKLSLDMQSIHHSLPRVRTGAIQKSVLGITLNQLEVAIMHDWRLSTLLRQLTDDAHVDSPQVRNAVLAANLARHLANGVDDPALADDFAEIARLLRTSPEWVRERVLPDQTPA
ncbi:MAG: HDOD domain-containing protein [Usitatibacteraceae bacterium]